jgi:hypothetical protein
MPTSGNLQNSYNNLYSLQSATYVDMHNLKDDATVPANGTLSADCAVSNGSACTDVVYKNVEYFDNAKADFSGYSVNPSICTTTVSSGSIQAAIQSASAGNVICVDAGNYAEDLHIDKNITLVALNSPNSTSASVIEGNGTSSEGIIWLDAGATGATVKGFVIDPTSGSFAHKKAGILDYVGQTTIDSNIVRNIVGSGTTFNGIYLYTTSTASDFSVTNNLIENLQNSAKGANGIMVQGNPDGVSITYNTLKDIVTTNTSTEWDYAMGIQDTPSSGYSVGPTNLVVEHNTINNVQSATEPGRGFGVDEVDIHTNWADASQVTLHDNNFLNIPNVLTNKDNDNHTLIATDNFFDKLTYNLNGASKDEIYSVDAGYMQKTSYALQPGETDQFATLAIFPKMLMPDTYTTTTQVLA